ncbi:MAG: FMN-dependent NADH-azoreductase [Archangiaceae bacterium]|nr:FMN-dependent NADH-azoreductase [Archangiaceae bacterium]
MTHALVLTCSPNGATSVSSKMLKNYLARRKARFPDETLTVRDLTSPENALPHLSADFVTAMFLPREARTPEQTRALELSDQLTAEFQSADTLIVATPIHNYTVPTTLKAWIDHVARPGVTFTYEGGVRKGLARARSAVFLLASGGVYTSGPQMVEDFLAPYLRHMMVFFGIPDVSVLRAEGVAWDAPTAVARAEEQIAGAF